MYWTRTRSLAAVAAVVALVLVGCSSGPKEDPLEAEWAAIQEAKVVLDAKRQELKDLEAEAAAAPEEGAEGEAAPAGDELTAPVPLDGYPSAIAALREEITSLADELMSQVVGFLNADPILADTPPNERQLAAVRLKSAEDVIVAREWIDVGGDYRQAIQIYENSLQLDPDNPQLQAALADAQEKRFMSAERFASVKKGMAEDAVREALGTPLHHNVKSYEDRGVTAWFYPTADDGAAAAVWFRPNDAGESICYLVKYDAVPGREAE